MSDARKRIYLFHTVFRACSTPFKECRVGFYRKYVQLRYKGTFRPAENFCRKIGNLCRVR